MTSIQKQPHVPAWRRLGLRLRNEPIPVTLDRSQALLPLHQKRVEKRSHNDGKPVRSSAKKNVDELIVRQPAKPYRDLITTDVLGKPSNSDDIEKLPSHKDQPKRKRKSVTFDADTKPGDSPTSLTNDLLTVDQDVASPAKKLKKGKRKERKPDGGLDLDVKASVSSPDLVDSAVITYVTGLQGQNARLRVVEDAWKVIIENYSKMDSSAKRKALEELDSDQGISDEASTKRARYLADLAARADAENSTRQITNEADKRRAILKVLNIVKKADSARERTELEQSEEFRLRMLKRAIALVDMMAASGDEHLAPKLWPLTEGYIPINEQMQYALPEDLAREPDEVKRLPGNGADTEDESSETSSEESSIESSSDGESGKSTTESSQGDSSGEDGEKDSEEMVQVGP